MSEPVTHVTEWGLGFAAGLKPVGIVMELAGLRADTHACSGRSVDNSSSIMEWSAETIPSINTKRVVPTCPRCAVLRDQALATGKVPDLRPPGT